MASLLAYLNTVKDWTRIDDLKEFMDSAKVQALVSACLYSIGYITFLGLFGAIMAQINAQNSDLNNDEFLCEEVRVKLRRSGNEFMGYSICAFVLITLSVIFIFCSAFLLRSSGSARVANSN